MPTSLIKRVQVRWDILMSLVFIIIIAFLFQSFCETNDFEKEFEGWSIGCNYFAFPLTYYFYKSSAFARDHMKDFEKLRTMAPSDERKY